MSNALRLPDDDRSAQDKLLAERRRGIGGTDAAAIIGASPWKTPLALWAEKRGLVEPPDISGVRRVRLGTALEPIIRDEYELETGRTVALHEPDFAVDAELDYLICHPDGIVRPLDGERDGREGVWEAKTGDARTIHEWDADGREAPLQYMVQVQHNLMVLGLEWGSFGALLGGNEFIAFDVERDDRFIKELRAREIEFWERVLSGDAPEPTADDGRVLQRLYPRDSGEEIRLGDEFAELDMELLRVKADIKTLEQRKAEIENLFRAAIGDASFGVVPGGGRYSYKLQTRAEHVVPASSFRVLRRSSAK